MISESDKLEHSYYTVTSNSRAAKMENSFPTIFANYQQAMHERRE